MSVPSIKDGDYLLCVSGHTRYAPYLADWRDFKDHIRKVVKEQPGWTTVWPVQGRKGEVQGWCKLKDKDDADAVYNNYARSRGVLVHVFCTSLRSSVFELMKCNCVLHFPDVGNRGHSPRRSGLDVNSVNQTFGGNRCALTTSPQYATPAQQTYSYADYYQNPPYTPASMQYPAQPAAPQVPCLQSTAGLPVNIEHGAVLTEARGIFIQGLNYSVRDSELASLIHSVGLRPLEVKVRKDSKGASKGVATATFNSKADAQYGVNNLNGYVHNGRTLTVRLDAESTVVGQFRPPPIVDGTVKYASGY
ncbi:hypothetical protein P280DRAFT_422042 [Massarina eburnea CBS 473.64]|uniref:RRM domain-containing protein n=1 Tax=Massarina eburnea CBS 473.64 TaxID=1395130 RepID=A0A6A6SA40_9PLEO|nr:hypothetical protein P280DRAFT_422042 [Massarina eburnea CBS 473.64]